ncbi:hypothetical protein Goari_027097, partial [Gossypium aridum]|nr:hypothetical protein [Gossypium aridum]
ETVGKVVKLDINTDSRTRGRFARLVVYVDLEKPLVSHILINGQKQNVEYESLSTICFHCGRFGHVENSCPFKISESLSEKENAPSEVSLEIQNTNKVGAEKENGNFGPWMIVEKKSRQKFRENHKEDDEGFLLDSRGYKGKEISQDISMGKDSVNGKPISEPSKSSSILKENSRNIDKSVSSLGNRDLTAGQARGVLGSSVLDLETQHLSTIDGRGSQSSAAAEMQTIPCDSMGSRPEGENSKNQTVLEDSRRDNIAVSLDVGNLNFGSQRTPLKESMEHLAKSISTFATPNLGVVNSGDSVAQIEGVNALG